jgi:hypothetical protein
MDSQSHYNLSVGGPLFSAALVLFLVSASFAQRGGGHPAGGHAGLAFGGFRSANVGHAGLPGRGPVMRNWGRRGVGFRPGGEHFGRTFDHRRFRRGFGVRAYPWVNYGYYGDPWLYDDYGDFSDYRSSYGDSADAYDPNGSLVQEEEIDRLREEVSELRGQQESRGRPGQSESEAPLRAEIHAETVLVFRDKHTQEVQNYAIVGKTLWVFDQTRATKFSLADLDIPATTKANEDRGIDFKTPG